MKTLLTLFLLVTVSSAPGQVKQANSGQPLTPATLARDLTSNCSNDLQKVTAIFRWVTENISYNIRAFGRTKTPPVTEDEPEDSSKVLKPLDERVAEMVLRRREAVCDGYSRLFKTLCDYANVRCEIIGGYARTGWGTRSRFRSNHKWNAVYFDSAWHLLDATWASGYITYRGDEFVREYDDRYFLASPEQFVRDHYPEDLSWTLMKTPPTLNEFYFMPFHYMAFNRAGVVSYFPSRGVIDAVVGDSIRFELEVSGNRNQLSVSVQPPGDTDDTDASLAMVTGKRASYVFAVNDVNAQWVYITCNGQTVLRYKLNVKRPDRATASASLPTR